MYVLIIILTFFLLSLDVKDFWTAMKQKLNKMRAGFKYDSVTVKHYLWRTHTQKTKTKTNYPSVLARVNQSQMFPSSIWYDVFGHRSGEPLWPASVVHWHPWVATLMGCQHHVTRGHGRATQDTQGTVEVDTGLGEQSLELLLGEKVTRLGKEGVEGHADGARDVTRFCVCVCERGKTVVFTSN